MFYRLPSVLARYKVGRTTIYRWINEGRFPAPTKLGPRTVAWRESDLLQWEAGR